MSNPLPLITCICITRDKPDLLRRAINCFEAQTYQNKELLIVYESHDDLTDAFINGSTFNQSIIIMKVSGTPKMCLGQLRNMAIERASGYYICQWDDDDWYHCHRLDHQFDAIRKSGRKGSLLNQWLVYDYEFKKAYRSNCRTWEGSILCDKETLQLKPYAELGAGEDTPVINFLCENQYLHIMEECSHLYLYICHGKNTWGKDYWQTLFEWSTELPENISSAITDMLKDTTRCQQHSLLLNELLNVH